MIVDKGELAQGANSASQPVLDRELLANPTIIQFGTKGNAIQLNENYIKSCNIPKKYQRLVSTWLSQVSVGAMN